MTDVIISAGSRLRRLSSRIVAIWAGGHRSAGQIRTDGDMLGQRKRRADTIACAQRIVPASLNLVKAAPYDGSLPYPGRPHGPFHANWGQKSPAPAAPSRCGIRKWLSAVSRSHRQARQRTASVSATPPDVTAKKAIFPVERYQTGLKRPFLRGAVDPSPDAQHRCAPRDRLSHSIAI